jgi:hypothetical protein
MLRFALGCARRAGVDLRSLGADASSALVAGADAEGATAGASLVAGGVTKGGAAGALSGAAGAGCAAGPKACRRAATEARPNSRPAAAAATIVQRERPITRCDSGPLGASDTLDTNGASLSGAWLGGGNDSNADGSTAGGTLATTAARLLTGVGIARNVIFSLALGGSGSGAGGGGGMLERNSGMCSDCGASPTRTTTA